MKKAFTMLELVFVLVVIGILAAVIIPKTKTNPLKEATVQLLAHLRYTQHLALVDDVIQPSENDWYKKRWTLLFGTSADYTDGKIAYSIFSDITKTGNPDVTDIVQEVAVNPSNNSRYLSGGYAGITKLKYGSSSFEGTKELNIGKKFGVTDVTFSGGCANKGKRIAFDNLGRPIIGNLATSTGVYVKDRLLGSKCTITLKNALGNTSSLFIEAETGYIHI